MSNSYKYVLAVMLQVQFYYHTRVIISAHLQHDGGLVRHTPDQLQKLFIPQAQLIVDALSASVHQAMKKQGKAVFLGKRGLFSHEVRSQLFDYLKNDPIPGFTLDAKSHRGSIQSVVLMHNGTGLKVRVRVLPSFTCVPDDPTITEIDDDPALAAMLFGAEMTKEAETVLLGWDYPAFDKDGVPGEIPVTIIRIAAGTQMDQGKADCVFALPGNRSLLPHSSFDPNKTSYGFSFQAEDEAAGDE